ncbi:MAG: iron-containing alcohol dehydrogenase [Treponema sp.]|nr:iron-containing alcohol dehydrogenase [Treponema sp.]
MDFSFSIPQNIVFGSGSLSRLPELASKLGKSKALIISGPHLEKIGLVAKCIDAMKSCGIESESFCRTEGNPSVETVEAAAALYKKCGADFIVAFGGGSPLDVAKAVAILVTYGGKITEYEGGGKVPGAVVPMIAIPTTAGTGSEVTAFSVITDHSRNYKLTVASNYLLPAYAVLDPDLISTVPAGTAAACGIDAMIHALESYISKAANPFSEMFSLRALELIGESIRDYVKNRENKSSAEKMLLGSLFAGIAFSHARLGDVHAMSHPVSAFFDVPHGVANAILLPKVVEFNETETKNPVMLKKYYDIYRCVCSSPVDSNSFIPSMLSKTLFTLNKELGIPSDLSEAGISSEDFERNLNKMAEDAMKSGNIAVNPRTTDKTDVIEIYRKSYTFLNDSRVSLV